MHTRSKLAILAGVAMISTGLVAGATPAGATGPCGSGYSQVGSYPIPKTGPQKGTLKVYYSSRSGKNCALAYGYGATYGKATYKSVTIGLTAGTRAEHDYGNYKLYAGPIYLAAAHKCIEVSGFIGTANRVLSKVHCG
ncbi:hypothetical protein [Streptosporangium sp. 'caverna']|uniref:hypothetical protein n=1 Tax=Streptosporangium sp. 'caverna' TaxID=2202249 RepID=UPI000D7DE920|nr:hypothetical protein [Streptosporangium sp. 'caverna']AWS44251.1 hypothetical protein DKM19_25770 [Streptosporangium sp. 'caverna']